MDVAKVPVRVCTSHTDTVVYVYKGRLPLVPRVRHLFTGKASDKCHGQKTLQHQRPTETTNFTGGLRRHDRVQDFVFRPYAEYPFYARNLLQAGPHSVSRQPHSRYISLVVFVCYLYVCCFNTWLTNCCCNTGLQASSEWHIKGTPLRKIFQSRWNVLYRGHLLPLVHIRTCCTSTSIGSLETAWIFFSLALGRTT